VDTTYFGIPPNGEYDFGGGTAYATEAIASASGTHNINVGDPLPDTLSGCLRFAICLFVAIAPPGVSDGAHIGRLHQPQRLQRLCRRHLEGHAKLTLTTVSAGVLHPDHRACTFALAPPYADGPWTMWSTSADIQHPDGWGPRVAISWAPLKNFTAHAG